MPSQYVIHIIFYCRVSYRERKFLSGKEVEKEKESATLRDEKKRLERLSALAATVPYFSNITNAKADIQKSTVARQNDVFEINDPNLACYQRGVMNSFTNDKIFSDSRFKLGHALREAGLSNTVYARAVIKKIIPREPERTTGIEPF